MLPPAFMVECGIKAFCDFFYCDIFKGEFIIEDNLVFKLYY